MGTITYRTLQADDAEAVRDTAAEAWQFTYAAIFAPAFIEHFVDTYYAPDRLRETASHAATGHTWFEVALDGNQVIGFCQVGITDHGAELWRIYLRPAYIGQGAGRALLHHAEEFVRSRGLSSYSCFVRAKNDRGKQFYLRNGFVHDPERERDDEWFMEKRLA
jgi:ribosomal protein S18 acetylase RimI-like enzyme